MTELDKVARKNLTNVKLKPGMVVGYVKHDRFHVDTVFEINGEDVKLTQGDVIKVYEARSPF